MKQIYKEISRMFCKKVDYKSRNFYNSTFTLPGCFFSEPRSIFYLKQDHYYESFVFSTNQGDLRLITPWIRFPKLIGYSTNRLY